MEQQHERNKMMNKYSLIFLVFLAACNTGYAVTDTSDAAVVPDVALDSAVLDDASVLVQDSTVPDAATPYCGDGVVNAAEQCDGNDLGALTCQTFGYLHGSLACNSSCAVDVSGCNNATVCGDGIAEGTEECDKADFKGQWCGDMPGFVAGQLVCTTSCTISTALCLVSVCGDEVKTEPYEECDGQDIGSTTCQGLGFDAGTLTCATDCTFNTAGCTMNPFCGDGVVDAGEECDEGGAQGAGIVAASTCEDFGMQSISFGAPPVITCWQCRFDTSQCADCGNGQREWGEACDGTVGLPTCTLDQTQTAVCAADCRSYDCSGCPDWLCD